MFVVVFSIILTRTLNSLQGWRLFELQTVSTNLTGSTLALSETRTAPHRHRKQLKNANCSAVQSNCLGTSSFSSVCCFFCSSSSTYVLSSSLSSELLKFLYKNRVLRIKSKFFVLSTRLEYCVTISKFTLEFFSQLLSTNYEVTHKQNPLV